MERNALLAFVISIAILIGYQMLFETPAPGPQPGEAVPSTAGDGYAAAPAETAPLPAIEGVKPNLRFATGAAAEPAPGRPSLEVPERTVLVDTDLYTAKLTSWGGRLAGFTLKRYRLTTERNSPLLDMVESDGALPLGLHWPSSDGTKVLSDASVAYQIEGGPAKVRADGKSKIVLRGTGPGGETLTKTLTFRGDSYVVGLEVSVDGRSDDRLAVSWTRNAGSDASRWGGIDGPTILVDGDLESVAGSGIDPAQPTRYLGKVDWAGYATHYFLAAFAPLGDLSHEFVASRRGDIGVGTLWTAGAGNQLEFDLFIGPKGIETLKAAGHRLDESVDLGWFTIVARPLLSLLLFIGQFVGNYGLAIIIVTVLIKLVMYPINQKQSTAMKKMQVIQPELKKIQEKYKDDRETLNKEMMELYRRHKVNPLSGCLPMVLQIPVFIGLYNALMQSIELRHAPFIGWITDLSKPDRLGTLTIPFVDPPGIPVLTLLMGASMLVQQRMMPAAGDPTQQRMMMLMPVVFTVMFVNFPAGLVIYWFANNVLTIAQQYWTNRSGA